LLLEPCDSDSCSHDIDHSNSNDSSCSVGALRAAVLVGAILIAVGDIIVLILAMVAMLIVIVRRIAVLAMVYGMVMVAVGAIIAVP
jgi:hypothetical protein